MDVAVREFLKSKGAIDCDFEIVAHEELSNNMSKSYNVGQYDWAVPKESDKKEISNGKSHYRTGKILEWMCAEKVIEPGEYVVDISW